MSDHDCAHQGHVWAEPDGRAYSRQRNRPVGKIAVACRHCPATAELQARGAYTRGTGPASADKTIPMSIQRIVARALEKAGQPNTGPAPME